MPLNPVTTALIIGDDGGTLRLVAVNAAGALATTSAAPVSEGTKSAAALNVVPPNADPVVLGLAELGYDPTTANAVFQTHVDGLDGGTFDVLLYLPGSPAPIPAREHQLGATSLDTVLIDGPIVTSFQIKFAGLGAAAAPIVYLNMQPRG